MMRQMDEGRVSGARVLAILREEFPEQVELAVRRALIEQQAEVIAAMRDAMTPEQVAVAAPSPPTGDDMGG